MHTPLETTAVLHAGSFLDEEKIRLKTHLPIAALPPDAPLQFIEEKILPIFVRSVFEKTNQFRFTCQDVHFPGAITLTMLDTVTKKEACPDAVRDTIALLQQQSQFQDQWNRWVAAPYEKILGYDIPLRFA